MANNALTTAQRIRARAEAAAKAEKEAKRAPRPEKRAAEGPAKASRSPKAAPTTAAKPARQSESPKNGSKNTIPAAKGPAVAKKAPKAVETPPWEVEFDPPVVAEGLDAAFNAGVEEVTPGRYINQRYDEETGSWEFGLRKTTTPGVYINSAGIMVDQNGIALSFQKVKKADDARWGEILGKPLETPAELLKAVALDPSKPLAMRIDAAKSAAPYTDRKKPIGIDGGKDGAPILMSIKELRGLPMEALLAIEATIEKNLLDAEVADVPE